MKHEWQGRAIVSPAHTAELEARAATHEFGAGMPRDEAEEKAYDEYRQDHHRQAAAHHLRGLKAAQASEDLEEAKKHGLAYGMHLQALGHDAMDPVPEEIRALVEAPDKKAHTKFSAHRGDRLLLGSELVKGDVLDFQAAREKRQASKKEAARAKFDDILSTIASDPGMQEQARKAKVQAGADKLQRGPQMFKVGDTVSCSHASHDGEDCSYPWLGTVAGIEPNIDTKSHHYEVDWQTGRNQISTGLHDQSELAPRPPTQDEEWHRRRNQEEHDWRMKNSDK